MASSLPIDLRFVAAFLRRSARSGVGLTPDQCERTAELLLEAGKEADRVVAQAELMPEIEDELLAVAGDLDRVAAEPVSSGYQAALKAQQQELQRMLDAEGPQPVSRPGLSALAMPIAGSNVTTFPIVPRPRPQALDDHSGGDAA